MAMQQQRWHLLLSAAIVIGMALALLGTGDRLGETQLAKATQRALIAFVSARGLNGAISVIQGTEVAIQPAGLGLTLTPGEVLDPVNDLVERFSWIMLASTISLGIQQVALEITASALLNALVLLIGLSALTALWFGQRIRSGPAQFIVRLALLMLVLRFITPAYALAGEAFFQLFLAQDYTSASRDIERARDDLRAAQTVAAKPASAQNPPSVWQRVTGTLGSLRDATQLGQQMQRLSEKVRNLAKDIVDLAVIFVIQSLVLPLFFLWVLVKLPKRIWQIRLCAT
ncbi:MAG: hypothetical protein GKR94_00710 [Gammaproteobacteria bacterium]|nr:hypothetical protein [Gammaproteobacteria bacterium]